MRILDTLLVPETQIDIYSLVDAFIQKDIQKCLGVFNQWILI